MLTFLVFIFPWDVLVTNFTSSDTRQIFQNDLLVWRGGFHYFYVSVL